MSALITINTHSVLLLFQDDLAFLEGVDEDNVSEMEFQEISFGTKDAGYTEVGAVGRLYIVKTRNNHLIQTRVSKE